MENLLGKPLIWRDFFFFWPTLRGVPLWGQLFGQIGEKFPLKGELLFCKKLKNDLAADLTNFLCNIFLRKPQLETTLCACVNAPTFSLLTYHSSTITYHSSLMWQLLWLNGTGMNKNHDGLSENSKVPACSIVEQHGYKSSCGRLQCLWSWVLLNFLDHCTEHNSWYLSIWLNIAERRSSSTLPAWDVIPVKTIVCEKAIICGRLPSLSK